MQADFAEVLRADLVGESVCHLRQRVAAVDYGAQGQVVQRAYQILLMLTAADDQAL